MKFTQKNIYLFSANICISVYKSCNFYEIRQRGIRIQIFIPKAGYYKILDVNISKISKYDSKFINYIYSEYH